MGEIWILLKIGIKSCWDAMLTTEMNGSDLVLIRISKIIEIGSLRKKLQPFKDHRKSEKISMCNEKNQ